VAREGLICFMEMKAGSVNKGTPYGWQFKGEDVFIEAAKGRGINYFALLSRDNKLTYRTTEQSINAEFIV